MSLTCEGTLLEVFNDKLFIAMSPPRLRDHSSSSGLGRLPGIFTSTPVLLSHRSMKAVLQNDLKSTHIWLLKANRREQ